MSLATYLIAVAAFIGEKAAASVIAGFQANERMEYTGYNSRLSRLSFRTASSVGMAVPSWAESEGQPVLATSVKKPGPKVVRKGSSGKKKAIKETEKEVGNFQCGQTFQTTYFSNKKHKCPEACPYFAQNKNDDLFCSFVCVADAMECIQNNPKATIADKKRGICRKPMVQYCKEYNYDGTDTCLRCNSMYHLAPDGTCVYSYMWLIWTLAVVGGLIGLILAIWLLDLIIRPLTNCQGLVDGLAHRSREKLRQPRKFDENGEPKEDESRDPFPLSTNMLRDGNVCGPGMLLHFNFQFALIVWAFLVGMIWITFAATIDHALFILGTRSYGTPRDNCILVAWGFRTQQDLMWTKNLFLVIVYCLTFGGCILHGIRQLRIFQFYDYDTKTMKDFVIMCENLPVETGKGRPAEDFKKVVEDKTKQEVVGVSIAWDMMEQEEELKKACWLDIEKIEKDDQDGLMVPDGVEDAPYNKDNPTEHMNPVRRLLWNIEANVESEPTEEDAQTSREKLMDMLENMKSTDVAFVVFNTEEARDKAHEVMVADGGMEYKGNQIVAKLIDNEPDTVKWENIGHDTGMEQAKRLFIGCFAIFGGLVFWTLCFYGPYAWSVSVFNYDNGQEPPFTYSIAFSMVVVVGNAIMYEICARVADGVGFRFMDQREACYMVLYTIACLFNVLLDFVCTYFVARQIMIELGFRTYYGKKLEDIPTFTQQFETYAMQRTLAENTYSYAFPSTFLIPFLIEPFVTIYFMVKIPIWLIRSHPAIKGHEAEEWCACIPMDMGRYADLLLNVILGLLIFYFPGGYTHTLFLGMAGSHIYIYLFDQYKVLRAIPSCNYATMEIDLFAQAMMAPCTGLIVSCLIFKSTTGEYCRTHGIPCLTGTTLVAACTAGWLVHTVLHLLILFYVVPLFGKKKPDPTDDVSKDMDFEYVAKRNPGSWFNTNPVHCLRSKHIYKQNPFCVYKMNGKEHHLQKNEAIGCYFEGDAAEAEDFTSLGGVPMKLLGKKETKPRMKKTAV